MQKIIIHKKNPLLVTIAVIVGTFAIFACGGGGGSDSSQDGDDDPEIIPLIPYEYYVYYSETQSPDTSPGTTVSMAFSTNNDLLEGSHWEGSMAISGTYGPGGPIFMESGNISFDFPFPSEPTNHRTSGIIPFTLEGTWNPVPETTFTVTQDVELVCFLDINLDEMQIMIFVNEGTQCYPGTDCQPFAALGPIDATVPLLQ